MTELTRASFKDLIKVVDRYQAKPFPEIIEKVAEFQLDEDNLKVEAIRKETAREIIEQYEERGHLFFFDIRQKYLGGPQDDK